MSSTVSKFLFRLLAIVAVSFGTAAIGHRSAETNAASLLPSGFLSVKDAQIVGPDGARVRIASVGLTGMNVVGGRLELVGPFHGIEGHVPAIKSMGFNCVRVDWINKTLDDESPPQRFPRTEVAGACPVTTTGDMQLARPVVS